jgi:hypothetical protein
MVLPFLTGKQKPQPRTLPGTARQGKCAPRASAVLHEFTRIFLWYSTKISEIRGKSSFQQAVIPPEMGEPVFV